MDEEQVQKAMGKAVALILNDMDDKELNTLYLHALLEFGDPTQGMDWPKSKPLFTENTSDGLRMHRDTRKQVLAYCKAKLGY